MTTIPANVDWVQDVCWMNLVSGTNSSTGTRLSSVEPSIAWLSPPSPPPVPVHALLTPRLLLPALFFLVVAQQQNKIYYVGGYSYLRSTSTPTRGGIPLANSHLYALDFSSSVDLEKNSSSPFTSVTRLPDLVPRISRGNFLWRESSLNFFGGAPTTFPIFLPNGTLSLADRVPISDTLFTDDISDKGTWTANSSFDYDGLQKTPIGKTAKAFDGVSDNGKGVLWFYGGAYWEDPVKVGLETKGTAVEMVEFEDLWRIPGNCDTKNVIACKQTTTTSGNSAAPRGYLQGTMVWVDIGDQGCLVLFGGTFRRNLVSMRNVHIYDIATSTWYTQPTTAESDLFPSDRIEACAVVAAAPDRTSYNIYVHGGYTNGTVNGGIWILTLPTFHWIRSPIGVEKAKAEHTCVKIQNKFMVVHRGVGVLGDSNCDENAGLTIVDLVTLEWVTKIDVSGGQVVYQVPDMVSKVLGGSGAGGATYSSPQNGFIESQLYSVFNVTSSSPLRLNVSIPSNTTHITSPSSSSSPSSIHKIAGSTLGGLLLIIIILSSVLVFIRRRRRKQREQGLSPGELPAVPGATPEMAVPPAPPMELPGGYWGAELPNAHAKGQDGRVEEKIVSPMAGVEQDHAPRT